MRKGFTLIELLLVISIISLLSSVFTANSAQARQKAADKSKQLQVREVEKAINLQKDTTGLVPQHHTSNPNEIAKEGTPAYNQSMQELVDNGYLGAIPKSPSGKDYSYWASENRTTAIFGAKLSNYTSSSKKTCSVALLPYEDCKHSYSEPPAGYTVVLDENVPDQAQQAYNICNTYGPNDSCRPNASGKYPNATCYQSPFMDGCLRLTAPFILYCKPFADSSCSGATNDFCGCVE